MSSAISSQRILPIAYTRLGDPCPDPMDDALSIWREQTRKHANTSSVRPDATDYQHAAATVLDTQQMCSGLYIEKHGFVDFAACQLNGASTPQQAKCAMCGTLGRGSVTSFTKLCPHIYVLRLPPTGLGIQSNIGVAGFVKRCSHMARRTSHEQPPHHQRRQVCRPWLLRSPKSYQN